MINSATCPDNMRWSEDDLKRYTQRRLKDEERARQNLYERANHSMGAVVRTRPQRNEISALDGAIKEQRQRKGRVAVRVTLIACRHRELDSDSAVFALKPLRDAVAASLGIDDADARIAWDYGQVVSRGEPGVIVRIEQV